MRKAHPEAWRSRSGPYVATLRGLRELWDLNRLTDTEGERLTEAWEHELRSSLKGIDDLDALETATGDYMLRHPRPVLQGRPFPEGPTEFGLLDRAILTQTEGAFVGLSTQVQHLRELLFEFEVRAELTPPASPGLRRAYAVDVLRQIAYVANCAERVSTCFALESFAVYSPTPKLGSHLARFRRLLAVPASSERRASPVRRPRSSRASRRPTRATRRSPSES